MACLRLGSNYRANNCLSNSLKIMEKIEDIAEEFKNFIEATFKGISKDELNSCMEVAET